MSEPLVLIVDDEESFVDALEIGLARDGFRTTVARDGREALDRFAADQPDLILLDVMLPRMSGIDVCRQIRQHSSVPIIMVTAKSSEIDTVVGLEIGADDYVSKPYRLRELVARVRALLRRSASDPAMPEVDDESVPKELLQVGGVEIDQAARQVKADGVEIQLPRKEYEVLHLLMANAGRVLTRDILIERVWGPDYVGDTKTLDVHVKRVRSKIEPNPAEPTRVLTVRGVGYKFARP